MKFEIEASDIERTGRGFLRAADLIPGHIFAGMPGLQQAVEQRVVEIIKEATPVAKDEPTDEHEAGQLGESTTATSILEGGVGATRFYQPATSERGYYYVQAVLQWACGDDRSQRSSAPIATARERSKPPGGMRPIVKAAPANDYITRVQTEIITATSELGNTYSHAVAEEMLRL
jgi:hypothetical protein